MTAQMQKLIEQKAKETEINKLEVSVTKWKNIRRGMDFEEDLGFGEKSIGKVHKKYQKRDEYLIDVVSYEPLDKERNQILRRRYIVDLNRGKINSMNLTVAGRAFNGESKQFHNYKNTIEMHFRGAS